MRSQTTIIIAIVFIGSFGSIVDATVTTYTNEFQWQAAVGEYTTITFTELPPTTWVSDQYAHLGITFDLTEDNHSQIQQHSYYVNDGVGLNSFGPWFQPWPYVRFTTPMHAIAIDTPNSAPNFYLIYQGALVAEVTVVTGNYFKGIISSLPFDEVRGMPGVIDDVYFGPPIPVPGVLALLTLAAFSARRRRA